MKRMAYAIALAAGTGLALGTAPRPALAALSAPAASGLQIDVNASGTASSETAIALDVTFHGGTVRTIELYVDGARVKRQNLRLRKDHGTIKFSLDAGLLDNGKHDILIKAIDAEGNTATATTLLLVAPDESDKLTRFLSPAKNKMVMGTLPIQIQVDAALHNPFVNFFVDNKFLCLTNDAPYTYNWDTTRIENGLHTLRVEVLDSENGAVVKTLSLRVNVNNPGGLTTRQQTTPDLNQTAAKTNSVAHEITRGVATAIVPDALGQPIDGHNGLSRGNGSPVVGDSRNAAPTRMGFPVPSRLTNALEAVAPTPQPARAGHGIAAPDSHLPPTTLTPGAANARPGVLGLLAEPNGLLSLKPASGLAGRLARQTARPRRSGNVAALPSLTLDGAPAAAATTNMHVKPITVAQRNTAPALVGAGALNGRARSFEVAFDNTRIAFDVQPRVEHGLPFAPFRQIFEHTGGQVKFYSKSKTIRAVNSDREIEFKVGQESAKVNNQTLKMDAKAFIEKGRAIVPISFVRDSLDVTIQYDAKTGKLRIETKK